MSSHNLYLMDVAQLRRRDTRGNVKPYAKRLARRLSRHEQNSQLPQLAHDAQIELGLVRVRGLVPDNGAIDAPHYREDDR